MLEIEYKGGNCVVLACKESRIVLDPNLSIFGLKNLTIKNGVELLTESRFNSGGNHELVLEGPGEYGVADFEIIGYPAQRHLDSVKEPLASVMYRVHVHDIKLAILGNIYEKLSEEQLENLGVIDILILPVGGGGYTLDAVGAKNIINKISPKIVIPVHYDDKGLKYEVPQDKIDLFIETLGAPVEVVSKYKISAPVVSTGLKIVQIERS